MCKFVPDFEKFVDMEQKKYWGKTVASFFLVLFTMPLGHALMKIMESEGMFLTLSEVITKESDAELRGKHFRLERR